MIVYTIEYKNKGILGGIIGWFTKQSYSHTAGFIDNVWVELDATNEYTKEPDYHTKQYKNIQDFLKNNPDKDRTVAFKIPYNFTSDECNAGIGFFRHHEKLDTPYGYKKLFRFIYLSKSTLFLKLYYKIKKRPYVPIGDKDGRDVCSEAWGIVLKKYMNWWFDKLDKKYAYLSPETTYPGMYAKILKKYRVEIKSK
jgi:hypothetical protein